MDRRQMLGLAAAAPFAAGATLSPAERCKILATDWANMARYRDANQAVEGPIETVFMGDSITQGWIDAQKAFFGSHRIDRGISGQTTPQMLVRFRQDVISLKPRCVHILGGINDIKQNSGPIPIEDSAANVASMADLARAHDIRVVIAAIMPARIEGVETVTPRSRFRAIAQEYCRRHDLVFVDYAPVLDDGSGGLRQDLTMDGIHLLPAGYRAIQPLADAAIRRALA